MFAEFAIGIGFGSLALLADAFHMLSDLLGLVIGGLSITVRNLNFCRTSNNNFLDEQEIKFCYLFLRVVEG